MAQTQTQIAVDLVSALSSTTSKVTNFNVGSLSRSLIDALSSEGAAIELEIASEVSTAILNAAFELLGVQPSGAVGSTYLLTFSLSSSATSSQTLASGTTVTIPNSSLQWAIGQSITLSPGGSQQVTATCTTTGSITNVPANTITQLVNPVSNVTVTNASAQPVVAGRDAETQTELQAQLSNQSNSLHKGDSQAIEVAALQSQLTDNSGHPTEQVVKALVVDGNTKGLAYCYVYNGTGPISTGLLTQTQNLINGYTDTNGNKIVGAKSAGVTVTATDAPQTSVDVSVQILPSYGYTLSMLQTSVQVAIQNFFSNLDLGTTLSLSQLYRAILAVQGVSDALITSPSSSLAAVPYVSAPSAPTLTAVSGSTSLSAGTYYVEVTFVNVWGETTGSAQSSVTLTAGQAIQVSAITLPVGADSVNYYLSTAVGSTTVAYDANGTGVQIDLTTLPATGAASPPSTNTAAIQGNAYVLGTTSISELTT